MALGRTRELKVLIVGDASSAQRALRSLDTSVNKSAGRVRNFATRYGTAIGATVLAGVGYAAKAASEAEKVTAQTEAVLKSTGGIANVTGKDIAALSEEIMAYSGQSDEAVQSGANLLLTFTNIRNETGKNNQVFDEATERIVDMSVAMDKDLNSSALMVGKALNDPIKGVTALGRAGVQFSVEQREMITALVETGQTLEAQKIILKELETQFGGSARAAGKTAAGQYAILREKVDNLAEAFGENLIPALIELAEVGEHVIGGGWAKDVGSVINDFFPDARQIKSIESSVPLAAAFTNQLRQGIITAPEYEEKIRQLTDATLRQGEEFDKTATAIKTVERISIMGEAAMARYAAATSRSISSIEGQAAAVARLNAQHLKLISNLKEIERLGVPGALVAGAGLAYTGTSALGGTRRSGGRKKVLMPGTYD